MPQDFAFFYKGWGRSGRGPWRMGITSQQTSEGDLIIWLSGVRQALVVGILAHEYEQATLQVIGTMWVSEDIAMFEGSHSQRLRNFDASELLPLQVDATTIFILISQGSSVD